MTFSGQKISRIRVYWALITKESELVCRITNIVILSAIFLFCGLIVIILIWEELLNILLFHSNDV